MSEEIEQPPIRTTIRKPEFESTIPDELLSDLKTEKERYLFKTLSKMEAELGWLSASIIQVNEDGLKADRYIASLAARIKVMEAWHERMIGKWGVIGIIGIALLPFLLQSAWDWAVHKKP